MRCTRKKSPYYERVRKRKINRGNKASKQRLKAELILVKEEKQQVKIIITNYNTKSYNELWCHLGL